MQLKHHALATTAAFFMLNLASCSDSESNADFAIEAPSKSPIETCNEEYNVDESAYWEEGLSDNTYLKTFVCDRTSYFLDYYGATCTKVKYNEQKNRFDITIQDSHGTYKIYSVHSSSDAYACTFKLGTDAAYIAVISDMGIWNIPNCLCKKEAGTISYIKSDALTSTEPERSTQIEYEQSSSSIECSSSSSMNLSVNSSNTVYYNAVSSSSEFISSSSSSLYSLEYFEDFEGDYTWESGTLENGYTGKALTLVNMNVQLPIAMEDTLPQGTIEFYFKPGENFDYKRSALVGNNEGRLTFIVSESKLFFFKNGSDRYDYVSAPVVFKDGWNKIAGQWDGTKTAIFLNSKQLAYIMDPYGYSPSFRARNDLYIGYKNTCCMTGISGVSNFMVKGSFDNIRVTSQLLYDFE